MSVEQLALEGSDGLPLRGIRTQATQKYHGNIQAFMAEARGRVSAGEQVVISAATLGELERFADLCHEYEMAYRLAEVDESAAGARLAEDSTAGTVPALLSRARRLNRAWPFPIAG